MPTINARCEPDTLLEELDGLKEHCVRCCSTPRPVTSGYFTAATRARDSEAAGRLDRALTRRLRRWHCRAPRKNGSYLAKEMGEGDSGNAWSLPLGIVRNGF